MKDRENYIFIIAIIFGFLLIIQNRSYDNVNELFTRDVSSNIFQEIKTLKDGNTDLRNEVNNLEGLTIQLSDQNLALKAIEEEIKKYKKLNGKSPIYGSGVRIEIQADIDSNWLVDFINELFNSTAQAVSINGIRITKQTAGFDVLPKGQIFLNGSILTAPYVFEAIGEGSSILGILELPGGIFDRIEASFQEVEIKTELKELVEMN